MRILFIIFAATLSSCTSNDSATVKTGPDSSAMQSGTDTAKKAIPAPIARVYANDRFKDVTIKPAANDHEFLIEGKAQIFEANFGWVIEDGHNELASGHEMTDAGAPEWGNFSFRIKVTPTPNTTPHLILFEVSAKDGSRQHELPIPLN